MYADQHYNPYDSRYLKDCKNLLTGKAGDDWEECIKRLRVLFKKCAENPDSDYWDFTTQNFLQRWPQLVGPPILTLEKETKEGKRKHAFAERMVKLQEEANREQ